MFSISLAFLRYLIPSFDKLISLPSSSSEELAYSTVVPIFAGTSQRLASRRRGWRAYSEGTSASKTGRSIREMIALELAENFAITDRMGSISEETTKVYLIDPVLNTLGWHNLHLFDNLQYEMPISTRKRPDGRALDVAFEFKSNSPENDQLSAANRSTPTYETIAHQVTAYGMTSEVNCVIYSNGRFWWRVEYDEDFEQFWALRFDMRSCIAEVRNNPRLGQRPMYFPPALARFIELFHSFAFVQGNNYFRSIHHGFRYENYAGTGQVFCLKNLNNGF